jgi:hypothetical protein
MDRRAYITNPQIPTPGKEDLPENSGNISWGYPEWHIPKETRHTFSRPAHYSIADENAPHNFVLSDHFR